MDEFGISVGIVGEKRCADGCPLGDLATAGLHESRGDLSAPWYPLSREPSFEPVAEFAFGIVVLGTEFRHSRLPRTAPQAGLFGKRAREVGPRFPGERPDGKCEEIEEQLRGDGFPAEREGSGAILGERGEPAIGPRIQPLAVQLS